MMYWFLAFVLWDLLPYPYGICFMNLFCQMTWVVLFCCPTRTATVFVNMCERLEPPTISSALGCRWSINAPLYSVVDHVNVQGLPADIDGRERDRQLKVRKDGAFKNKRESGPTCAKWERQGSERTLWAIKEGENSWFVSQEDKREKRASVAAYCRTNGHHCAVCLLLCAENEELNQ